MHITIFSLLIISLSFIILCFGPMINGSYYTSLPWYGYKNIFDEYDCNFFLDSAEKVNDENFKDYYKKLGKKCKRFAAMEGLEYTVFTLSLSIGFMYLFFHFQKFTEGKVFSSIVTSIGFIITIIYIGYSGYIFNNDSSFNNVIKTNSNGAFAKLDKSTGKYVLLYPKENEYDYDSRYAKIKDLKEKQYNYDKLFYFSIVYGENTEFRNCLTSYDEIDNVDSGQIENLHYTDKNGNEKVCNYLYYYDTDHTNKYGLFLYNTWLTTLIMACLIALIEIIIIIYYCQI